MSQQKIKIVNRLKSLEDIDDVSISSTEGNGTIKIEHARHHGLEFLFRWASDHFVGYFIDAKGNKSQAVISLYTGLDAIKFATSYALLVELRANQKGA